MGTATFPASARKDLEDFVDLPPDENEEKEQKEEEIKNEEAESAYFIGPQWILLPDADRRCLWQNLDESLGKIPFVWTVPARIDPLPSSSSYNSFVEKQQALSAYLKNKKDEKLQL